MKRVGGYLLRRLTFKRLVVLIILTLIALPIVKGVFNSSPDVSYIKDDYEYKYVKGQSISFNKILAVPIQGIILTESTGIESPLDFLVYQGIVYGYDVKESLIRAAKDNSIKGVLLQINSPGGTIGGSKAIADGVAYYKAETGNPVYAHIRDIGASGAYWAAISGDRVFAEQGSIIGSIGVIMGPFRYYDGVVSEGGILGGVSTKNGIEYNYFTAGQYKDTGSPYRRMTAEERDHWQTSLNNEYEVFVDHVAKYRKLSKSVVRQQIKALPYETKRAQSLGLIDELGSEETALEALLRTAGIKGDNYELILEKKRGGFWAEVFSVASKVGSPQATRVCTLCDSPLYLYDSSFKYLNGSY